jgi:hypothetical protein
MSIVAFFQQSAGRWSSIKSNHHVSTTQQQSGRSTVEMELLTADDASVITLCEKQGMNPSEVAAAAKVTWDGFMEGSSKNEVGSAVLVAIGNEQTGTLLRSTGNFGVPAAPGRYGFGEGGEFLLTIEDSAKNQVTTERVWFESENVRMRHNKIESSDGQCIVAFWSEVRLLGAKSS